MINGSALTAFCVAGCFLAQPSTAEACSCAGNVPLSLHAKSATTIFVGTVEAVTGRMPQPTVATFSVTKAYRGALEQSAVVSGNGTNCDRTFVKGETYLVYATAHPGVLLTHKCTRTRALAEAAEDVRYLDNLAAGRPQGVVYGDVHLGIVQPDGSVVRNLLSESLEVVAVRADSRRSVVTYGPYQMVLTPGDYEVWIERGGHRVTASEKVSRSGNEERRLSFTVEYR